MEILGEIEGVEPALMTKSLCDSMLSIPSDPVLPLFPKSRLGSSGFLRISHRWETRSSATINKAKEAPTMLMQTVSLAHIFIAYSSSTSFSTICIYVTL